MCQGTWGVGRGAWGKVAAAAITVMCLVGAQAKPWTEAPTLRGRLQPRGQTLVYPDGTRFLWRGVTAFQLVDHVADGREDRARVFLSWARATGFSVVRVLAMASGLFELAPADGLRALPRLLALAAEYDLYVEVVALSDTRAYPALDLPAHVRAVGAACDRAPNSLLEVANEPYHPTHVPGLTAARLAALASGVPARVPVALGAASSDTCARHGDAPRGLRHGPSGTFSPPVADAGAHARPGRTLFRNRRLCCRR